MTKRKAVEDHISADSIMCDVAQCLISDFRENLSDASLFSELSIALRSRDAVEIRQNLPTPSNDMDPPMYKATYQMQCLLKRHRFEKDLYTDDELKAKAVMTFCETQDRIANIEYGFHTRNILHNAKRFISRCLGPYDEQEHRDLCRFGRRASVGVPGRLACEAARWELPISGSKHQIDWFDAEMRHIETVQEYWAAQLESDPPEKERSIYQEVDTLKLTFVPKTYKALRSIVPNTTIGSYMSYGLGELMRKRLKRIGYNIRTLQKRHRLLAQDGSFFQHLVTADLSSASDSISTQLVAELFPEDWLQVLLASRIGQISLPTEGDLSLVLPIETFCTMGIGYTFPLQTLVFLALIKGIEQYFEFEPGTVSVYGDDLIYPVAYHDAVCSVFEKLGFQINKEKSFATGPFRESCGGDYYRGRDVRPFQPEGDSTRIRMGKSFEAVLYKLINGLLFRWSEYEIRRTLDYLVGCLERNGSLIKRVPFDFPDTSGIKCPGVDGWDFLQHARCGNVKHVGHGLFRFEYLTFVSDTRKEERHEPYYWLALRDCTDQPFDYGDPMQLRQPVPFISRLIDELTGVHRPPSRLIDRVPGPKPRTYRSRKTGRRYACVETHVTISDSGSYRCQQGVSVFLRDRRTP